MKQATLRGHPWQSRHALFAAIVAVALVATACGEPTLSEEAESKAQELTGKLESVSPDFSVENAEHVFAEDGAHLCAAADSKDHLALVAFTPNSFALRKLEVDRADVELARIVIDVYCPENRTTFDDYVSGLNVEGSSG